MGGYGDGFKRLEGLKERMTEEERQKGRVGVRDVKGGNGQIGIGGGKDWNETRGELSMARCSGLAGLQSIMEHLSKNSTLGVSCLGNSSHCAAACSQRGPTAS